MCMLALTTHQGMTAGRAPRDSGTSRCRWWWPVRQEARSSSPERKRKPPSASPAQSPEPRSRASPWCHARFHAQLAGKSWNICINDRETRFTHHIGSVPIVLGGKTQDVLYQWWWSCSLSLWGSSSDSRSDLCQPGPDGGWRAAEHSPHRWAPCGWHHHQSPVQYLWGKSNKIWCHWNTFNCSSCKKATRCCSKVTDFWKIKPQLKKVIFEVPPVVRPEAYSDRTAWMATYMAGVLKVSNMIWTEEKEDTRHCGNQDNSRTNKDSAAGSCHLAAEVQVQLLHSAFVPCTHLRHLLPVGLGVERSLGQQDGMLLRSHTQLVVEGVMPDLQDTQTLRLKYWRWRQM